jgi:RHS repeat-associated protein
LNDYLGFAVAITNDAGNLIDQQRYMPFGQVRYLPGSPAITNTDFGYTGQRELDPQLGLMDYKARFYSPLLGKFVQPDTIVPEGPIGLNRYAYANNNPVKFTDPSGHCAEYEKDGDNSCIERLNEIQDKFGVVIDDSTDWWDIDKLDAIAAGMEKLQSEMGKDGFESLFTGVELVIDGIDHPNCSTKGMCALGDKISIGSDLKASDTSDDGSNYMEGSIVHELAHVWDHKCGECMSKGLMKATGGSQYKDGWLGLFGEVKYNPGNLPKNWNPPTRGEDWANSVRAYLYPSWRQLDNLRSDYVRDSLADP